MEKRVRVITEKSPTALEHAINQQLEVLKGKLHDIKLLCNMENKYHEPYCALLIYTPEEK